MNVNDAHQKHRDRTEKHEVAPARRSQGPHDVAGDFGMGLGRDVWLGIAISHRLASDRCRTFARYVMQAAC